jgi:hypothetical protein
VALGIGHDSGEIGDGRDEIDKEPEHCERRIYSIISISKRKFMSDERYLLTVFFSVAVEISFGIAVIEQCKSHRKTLVERKKLLL